jgi:predicted PurR-regulated permease PerM
MLAIRHRFNRNPYFQFHPLHTLFSLVAAVIMFGLLVWFLAVPAR